MKRVIIALGIISAVLFSVLPSPAQAAGTATLRGRVVNESNTTLEASVRLERLGADPMDVKFINTDGNGVFSESNLTAGTWEVRVFIDAQTGYLNGLSFPTVVLTEGQTSELTDYVLRKGVSITAKIVDENNEPISGASLNRQATETSDVLTIGTTFGTGIVTGIVESGTPMYITARKGNDYQLYWHNNATSFATATPITPIADTPIDLGTIVLKNKPLVSGVMKLSNGQPAVGVVAFGFSNSLGELQANTDDAGEYSIRLQPGRYLVSFRPANPAYPTTFPKGRGSSQDSPLIDITADRTINITVPVALNKPVFTSAKRLSRVSAELKWASIPGATGYQIRVRTGVSLKKLGKYSAPSKTTTLLSYRDTSAALKKKPVYACYQARSVKAKKVTAWTSQRCIKLG